MHKKKKSNIGRKQAIIFILLLGLAAGIVLGCVSAQTYNSGTISSYLNSYQNQPPVFSSAFFKYLKYIIIIWFLAFVPAGGFFVFVINLFKGASIGFTAVIMYNALGQAGLFTFIKMSLPHILLFIPANLIVSYFAIYYIFYALSRKKENAKYPNEYLGKYVFILIFGIIISLLTAYIDVNIFPFIL